MADSISILISAKETASGVLNAVSNGVKDLNAAAKSYHSTVPSLLQ